MNLENSLYIETEIRPEKYQSLALLRISYLVANRAY